MKKSTTAIEILNERVLQVNARLDVSDSKDDGLSSYIYLSQVQTSNCVFWEVYCRRPRGIQAVG